MNLIRALADADRLRFRENRFLSGSRQLFGPSDDTRSPSSNAIDEALFDDVEKGW